MSGLINKVKDALHSDKDKTHEQPQGTAGPHSSRAANTADPRVDSDRDHRANPTTGTHSTTGTTGGLGSTGTHSTTTGTHGSSGLTGSNTHGTSGIGSNTHGSSGLTGSNTHGSSGLTGTHGTTGTGGFGSSGNSGLPEGSVGPHSSRAANAADPRVDSDLDGSRNVGGRTGGTGSHALSGAGTHGTTGTHGSSGLTGSNTHGSSGLTGSNTHGTSGIGSNTHGSSGIGSNTHGSSGIGGAAAHGSGPAPNTAGPHKSDALNKADPRVDSDLDGSKTVGQDKTFAQSNDPTNFAGRDPTDATQVPPSILQKHVGGPAVHHDNPEHGHSERHSISHQEEHRGL